MKRNRVAFTCAPGRNSKKGIISKFEVKPQKRTQNTFIVDKDIIKILETSYKTLTYCNLVSCMFINCQTFESLANAVNLQWLCVSNNQNLLDAHAIKIINNCTGLLHLDFSKCSKLTENTMDAIVDNLALLETLDISHNSVMVVNFRNPAHLKNLKKLTELDISYCSLSDCKLLTLIKNLQSLEVLNLEGCSNLTIESLNEILLYKDTLIRKINVTKTQMERDSQADLKKIEESKGKGLELIYHRE